MFECVRIVSNIKVLDLLLNRNLVYFFAVLYRQGFSAHRPAFIRKNRAIVREKESNLPLDDNGNRKEKGKAIDAQKCFP